MSFRKRFVATALEPVVADGNFFSMPLGFSDRSIL